MEKEERYFKLVNPQTGEPYRFTGDTPKQAASKAFTKIMNDMRNNNITSEPIVIKEKDIGRYTKKMDKTTNEPRERYFKLLDPETGKSYGRYTGDTPKQAASKGFTKILQQIRMNGKEVDGPIEIHLRESTRGSTRKTYRFMVERQELDKPMKFEINDESGNYKTLSYSYRNKIRRIRSEKTPNENNLENANDDSLERLPATAQKEEPAIRYFKLVDPETGIGRSRFTGATPKQAASKAFTRLLQEAKHDGREILEPIDVWVRESSRGSARKLYCYKASRVKLDKPQVIEIEDPDNPGQKKTITYEYRNRVIKTKGPGDSEEGHSGDDKTESEDSNSKSNTTKESVEQPIADTITEVTATAEPAQPTEAAQPAAKPSFMARLRKFFGR